MSSLKDLKKKLPKVYAASIWTLELFTKMYLRSLEILKTDNQEFTTRITQKTMKNMESCIFTKNLVLRIHFQNEKL